MSKRPSRTPRWRRSCCLTFVLTLIVLLLCAAGGFAWLYNHPVSNSTLHERVLRRLERISGLDVAYDSASLTLATGQYQIRNLRFTEPGKQDAPLLTIDEVLASIQPWQLLMNPESVLTKVVLKNPSQLDLLYSQRSLRLGDKSQFLLDSVQKAQPPEAQAHGRLPFDELKIENAEVAFVEEEGILPDPGPAKPAMIMEGELTVENQDDGKLAFTFNGHAQRPGTETDASTTSTMGSGIKTVVVLDKNNAMTVEGNVDRVALTHVFREMPDTSIKAAGLKLDLSTRKVENALQLQGTVKAGQLAYISPETAVQLVDEKLNLDLDLDYNTSTALADLRRLRLQSEGALTTTTGKVAFAGKRQYDMAFSASRLSKDYRVLLERLLPPGWDVEATRDSLSVDMTVAGDADGVQGLNGNLAVRGINLITPALPAALKNLYGDVTFGNESINFSGMTGEYAGARVALDGAFAGDPWVSKSGDLNLNWSTIIPLEEVLALHGNSVAQSQIGGSGQISGNGTWQQHIDLGNASESGTPNVQGEINFENVGLQYAALPAPIAGLSGKTRIVENRLEIESLTGTMQGNKLEVAGVIEGKDFFWRDAQVSASLTSRLDLERIGPYLTPEQQRQVAEYQLKGNAETQVVIKGPVNDLGSRFTGAVTVSDVSFNPRLEFMNGTFTGVDGILRWDGSRMQLEEINGLLNGEEVALAGTISSNRIDLTIKSDPTLEMVERTFPYMDKYLDMSGQLECDLRWTAGDSEVKPASMSIGQMMAAARELADKSIREKTASLDGELHFRNGNLRHIAMPPARTENGRKIPEGRVTGLTGRLLVKNDTLTVPGNATMSCAFADTPNCRLSGTIKIRPDHFPEMDIKISSGGTLKLDTWALGWGKELDRPDQPPVTNKKFDLTAEIVAPSVIFRGQPGGRSLGKLTFNMVQNNTPRITNFREVVIQGARPGMGNIVGSGRIDSFVWDEQRFPKWQATLAAQDMPLESMLTAVFVTPSTMRGMYSGNLNIEGIGTNANSIRGQGSGRMTNLEIGGTPVIRELGQTTGRNFGGTQFETAHAATFEIGNGAVSSRDLALQTNGLMLEMRGDYYFAGNPARGIPPKTIDGALRLRLFKSVFGSIPIIGQVADLADEVTNAFLLAFRVTGNASDPRVTPVALPVFQGGA